MISKRFDYFKYCEARSTLHQDSFYRSYSYDMLVPASQPSTTCKNCQKQNVIVNSEINRKQANLQIPGKLNAPIKFTSPEIVKLTIQHHRLKCKQPESRIEEMQTALEQCRENVPPELNNDLITIYSGIKQNNIPPFMKLFWEEQQK